MTDAKMRGWMLATEYLDYKTIETHDLFFSKTTLTLVIQYWSLFE